jgi:hypothetical protein
VPTQQATQPNQRESCIQNLIENKRTCSFKHANHRRRIGDGVRSCIGDGVRSCIDASQKENVVLQDLTPRCMDPSMHAAYAALRAANG